MKYTEALAYVETRARQYRNLLGDKKDRIEYYFHSLLVLVNADIKRIKMFKSDEVDRLEKQMKKEFKKSLKVLEERVKEKIKEADPESLIEAERYINIAKKYATESYMDQVDTLHLLAAIMKDLTPVIKESLKDGEPFIEMMKKEGGGDVSKGVKMRLEKVQAERRAEILNTLKKAAKDKEEQQMKLEYNELKISELMKKVSNMTSEFLKKIKGQDHAVRTVAEGYFNAELLADSDQKRVKPLATFLFAGPPGVGKTYLAELMSQYLGLPYMRFDMSNYSDHHAGEQLIGQTAYYSQSKEGVLTSFVKKNPRCVLLFDEIEKAHTNVIYLFYQMLDAGVLEDQKTNETISFKDTYIIFTTNAGHNLYEGKEDANLSLMSRKKIISGIQNDINPLNNEPFFPTAMCSRLASGNVVMFNHLQSHHLLEIMKLELEKNAKLFEQEYGIQVEYDDKIPSLLMYKEGGIADARSLRAQCEAFFKAQILQSLELFDFEKEVPLLDSFKKVKFYAEDFQDMEQLNDVFKKPQQKEILFYGNDNLGVPLSKALKEYSWNITSNEEAAFDIFSKKDIQVVLLDIMSQTAFEEQKKHGGTFFAFDKISVTSKVFDNARAFVEKATERFPEVPICLIDKGMFQIDDQLKLKFIQLGVREIVDVKDNLPSTYRRTLDECIERSYLQSIANYLKTKHQMVRFEISSKFFAKEMELHIRSRNYALSELVDAEDEEHLVSAADRPTIKFHDVIGASDAKEELKFFTEYLKNPKSFVAKGLKPAKGVLFYGPPGTGKTMLAKAMAGETDITFISESAANFVTKYTGSGPAAVRDMFKRARRYAPTILFIDEIDAIGRTRTGSSNTHAEEATLNALLTEMDGFKVDLKRPVFIIAATNFKVDEGISGGTGYIDPALVRRFDKKIKIDLLNKKERYQLFDLLLKKAERNQVSEKMKENIAERAIGKNSSNLSDIVSSAVSMAQKRNLPITDAIFEEAFETFVYGNAKDLGPEYLERVAWHEAGHAYMYWKNGQVPSYLTITARGDHGGYMQMNEKDVTSPLRTKEELLRSIRVALAGRASELVHFGAAGGTSTGIAQDLKQATDTAKSMICSYGMDDELGLLYIDESTAGNSEMAMWIHKKAASILNEQMKNAMEEIQTGYPKVERLVKALMAQNSMTGEEIDSVLRL